MRLCSFEKYSTLSLTYSSQKLGARFINSNTVVYKTIEGCNIKADILAREKKTLILRPCVFFIHGGGFIFGSRSLDRANEFEKQLLMKFLAQDFVVVSVDYRLAPETKLPSIIEDIKDACKWIRTDAASLGIDNARIACLGGSAGGYLSLLCGHLFPKDFRAVVSLYSYSDFAWASTPSFYYRKLVQINQQEAYASIGSTVISEEPLISNRKLFYIFLRQRGLWKDVVFGDQLENESDFDITSKISSSYPPTFLVHGTDDNDVPYDEFKKLDNLFRSLKVDHYQSESVKGGNHFLSTVSAIEKTELIEKLTSFVAFYTSPSRKE